MDGSAVKLFRGYGGDVLSESGGMLAMDDDQGELGALSIPGGQDGKTCRVCVAPANSGVGGCVQRLSIFECSCLAASCASICSCLATAVTLRSSKR